MFRREHPHGSQKESIDYSLYGAFEYTVDLTMLEVECRSNKIRKYGSISVSGQLPTYPSPNPNLLSIVNWLLLSKGRGRWAAAQIPILIRKYKYTHGEVTNSYSQNNSKIIGRCWAQYLFLVSWSIMIYLWDTGRTQWFYYLMSNRRFIFQ